ncbi:MAG: hypothetical protein ACKVSF_06340, partial [Alphaproteobacteria bacterium]
GEAGVPRVVMSRNAHAAPDRPLARDSAIGYLRARYPRDLVDQPLFWSPAGARAGECARRPGEWPRIRPFRIPARAAEAPQSATRTVLFADTYAAWWLPHSWIFLNGDEVLAAIRGLAAAIGTMTNTHLVVRAKNKPECDLDALLHHVRPPPNCEIKMRDVPFTQDLARADLLVAFHSSTIEEAIAARRPVLIWGSTSRHAYMPAREIAPTRTDRGAIYRINAGARLGPMIAAILESHAGLPLTDSEITPYIWPPATPMVDDLAVEIAMGPAPRCGPTSAFMNRHMPESQGLPK